MNTYNEQHYRLTERENANNSQIFNDIKSILAQITATSNPAELGRLAGQAKSLKSDNQFINDIIENIQASIIKKQETIEAQINSEFYTKDLEKLERQIQEEEIRQYKARIAEQIMQLNSNRIKFKNTLEEYKKLYTPLEEMVKKDSKGEPIIDEKAVDKNILTHEEVEEQRQSFAELKEHEKAINKIFEKAQQEKEELEKEIKSLSQIKKQNLTIEQIKEIENKLEYKHTQLEENKVLLQNIQHDRQNIKSEINKIKSLHEKDHIKINQLGEAIEKTEHTRSSEKHQQLKQKHSLLSNQHKAIVHNKELSEEDKSIRKNVVNQIKTQHKCDQIKDSLNNSVAEKSPQQSGTLQINNANTKKIGRER